MKEANTGATAGPLTLRGHLKDATGTPIVGGRVDLFDTADATRLSDFTGGFRFHVEPGSYSLRAAGDCSFVPAVVHLGSVTDSVVQDFTATGPGCTTAAPSNVSATGSVLKVTQGKTDLGFTYVHIEDLPTQGEARTRLRAIADEQPAASCALSHVGDSATERKTTVSLPGGEGRPAKPFIALTTAIVVGQTIIRFESQLEDASPAAVDRFFAAARAFTPEEMVELQGPAKK